MSVEVSSRRSRKRLVMELGLVDSGFMMWNWDCPSDPGGGSFRVGQVGAIGVTGRGSGRPIGIASRRAHARIVVVLIELAARRLHNVTHHEASQEHAAEENRR